MVLYGSELVLYGSEMVLDGSEMILYVSEPVLYGLEMVLYGLKFIQIISMIIIPKKETADFIANMRYKISGLIRYRLFGSERLLL